MRANPAAPHGTSPNPLFVALPQDAFYQPTYEWPYPVRFEPFWLVFPTFGPMTAALIQQQTVQVPNESDFEIRRIVYHAELAGAVLTQATAFIPNVLALFTLGGTSRQLANAAIPLASFASPESSFTPADLPWPIYAQKNDTLGLTLTNFDVAQITLNVRVTLVGRKIYRL